MAADDVLVATCLGFTAFVAVIIYVYQTRRESRATISWEELTVASNDLERRVSTLFDQMDVRRIIVMDRQGNALKELRKENRRSTRIGDADRLRSLLRGFSLHLFPRRAYPRPPTGGFQKSTEAPPEREYKVTVEREMDHAAVAIEALEKKYGRKMTIVLSNMGPLEVVRLLNESPGGLTTKEIAEALGRSDLLSLESILKALVNAEALRLEDERYYSLVDGVALKSFEDAALELLKSARGRRGVRL